MAPGSGKTVLFTLLTQHILSNSTSVVWVVVHRDTLVQQAYNKMKDEGVESITIMKAGHNYDPFARVVIVSIQTYRKRRIKIHLTPPTHIIIDEAQYSTAESYLLLDEDYPHAFRLGVTGTPYVQGKKLHSKGQPLLKDGKPVVINGVKQYEPYIYDHFIQGPQTDDLIEQGYLVPVKYMCYSTPEPPKTSGADYTEAEAASVVKIASVCESYLKYGNNKKAIVFAPTVELGLDIVKDANGRGIGGRLIHAKTPLNERRQAQREHGEKFMLLVNYGIYTEGYDDPDLHVVIYARLTKNPALFHQMNRAGRVPWDVIKGLDTAQDRREAIVQSRKPYCTIIDVCGAWQHHIKSCKSWGPSFNEDWEGLFYGGKPEYPKDMRVIDPEAKEGGQSTSKNITEVQDVFLTDIREYTPEKKESKEALEWWIQEISIARAIGKPKIGYAKLHAAKKKWNNEFVLVTRGMVQKMKENEQQHRASLRAILDRIDKGYEVIKEEQLYTDLEYNKEKLRVDPPLSEEEITFLAEGKVTLALANIDRYNKEIQKLQEKHRKGQAANISYKAYDGLVN
jgi:superfamily II DNA or RNA helicase